jgi:hypothetical protein
VSAKPRKLSAGLCDDISMSKPLSCRFGVSGGAHLQRVASVPRYLLRRRSVTRHPSRNEVRCAWLRACSATMAANQLRMWFSAMAYVLVDTLRRIGLRFTQFADASAQTIRLRLLKLGGAHQRTPHSLRDRLGLPQQGRVRTGLPLSTAYVSAPPGGVTTPKCRAPIRRAMTRVVTYTHRAKSSATRGARKMSAKAYALSNTPTAKIRPRTRRSANKSRPSLRIQARGAPSGCGCDHKAQRRLARRLG